MIFSHERLINGGRNLPNNISGSTQSTLSLDLSVLGTRLSLLTVYFRPVALATERKTGRNFVFVVKVAPKQPH